MALRSVLYTCSFFKRTKTPVFSIGIGNLTVGGTGKTPHIEYLIRTYGEIRHTATLSRGYGRKSKGFLVADASKNASLIGDEPWQFFLKFGSFVRVVVGEKRVPAAQQLHKLFPEVNLLLLDDVYQHIAIEPDVLILLCDYNRPFFKDYPFPAGRLREFRQSASRADLIIVSKCPEGLSTTERQHFQKELQRYAPGKTVAFSRFRYDKPVPVYPIGVLPSKWLLVTGIAQPGPLVDYLNRKNLLVGQLRYADHHEFSVKEMKEVKDRYQELGDEKIGILLTEKDFARLSEEVKESWKSLPVFYIPIVVEFIEGEQLIHEKIQEALRKREALSD